MGRPKLNSDEKKTKLGITISKNLNYILSEITNNKSKFIEDLLREKLKDILITKTIDVKYDENVDYKSYKKVDTIITDKTNN